MGLDVCSRRDVANVLRATACASESAAQQAAVEDAQLTAYRQGVRDALVSVGLAFGLEPVQRQGQASGVAGLLWAEVPRE